MNVPPSIHVTEPVLWLDSEEVMRGTANSPNFLNICVLVMISSLVCAIWEAACAPWVLVAIVAGACVEPDPDDEVVADISIPPLPVLLLQPITEEQDIDNINISMTASFFIAPSSTSSQ